MEKIVKEVDIKQGAFNSLLIADSGKIKANYYNFELIYCYDTRIMHYVKLMKSKRINFKEFRLLVIAYIKWAYEVDYTYMFIDYFLVI